MMAPTKTKARRKVRDMNELSPVDRMRETLRGWSAVATACEEQAERARARGDWALARAWTGAGRVAVNARVQNTVRLQELGVKA